MEVSGAHPSVMGGGMMFSMIVGKVSFSWAPVDNEVALASSVLYPIETHVHCFGAFLADGGVDNARSSIVVGTDGCRRLRMAHFNKGCSDGAC